MVLAASHKASPTPWYSGTSPGSVALRVQGFHLLWHRFPGGFLFGARSITRALQPRCSRDRAGLGCSPFARHYLGNHCCFLFLRVLRCFSSPGSLPKAYVFSQGMTSLQDAGLPHSEIRGSKLVCSSPQLIAAYHVLHRLPVPRHPPYALNCLNL